MLFVFFDKPDSSRLRMALMDAHLEWLRCRRDKILAAGSLRPAPESAAVGGLWIVDAADKSEVEALLDSDPFWLEGLRERVEILSWHRAFPEPVLI
ncbi:hypothetical protein EV147_5146 [Cupriavidus agavae]|uniref:YCII-related domain-containing protein n=2 Tax=Cupriavidus agavae TaxID=1001822 RepID=A0A4Q7R954_9BURK|nr:YciI family protein [Cupriavidus agavae]RZT28837.1 hypothetical protein EV147_5146 [Cupriavidus agavae]